MNYRIPSYDVLAGTKVTFFMTNKVKDRDVYLVLIDAYSLKKMKIKMRKILKQNKLTLPFNESGEYLYYFEFRGHGSRKYFDVDGMKNTQVINPFSLIVYKENYIVEPFAI